MNYIYMNNKKDILVIRSIERACGASEGSTFKVEPIRPVARPRCSGAHVAGSVDQNTELLKP